jgi:hypothetical protein
MDELKRGQVTIKGVSNKLVESIGATVFEIDTNEGMFNFWATKKDGNPTKAYEQFQQFRFMVGDTIKVAYKESDASYNNSKTGVRINKVNKTIVFFETEDKNTPAKVAPITQTQVNTIMKPETEVEVLRRKLAELEKENIPVIQLDTTDYSPTEVEPEDLYVGGEKVPF